VEGQPVRGMSYPKSAKTRNSLPSANSCASRILEAVAIHEVLSSRGFAVQVEVLALLRSPPALGKARSSPHVDRIRC
jgi:hypothetical protein